jgi:hypothetical protein
MILADRIKGSVTTGAPRILLHHEGAMRCAWCGSEIGGVWFYHDETLQPAETCLDCGRESVAVLEKGDTPYSQGLRSPADLKYMEARRAG